MVSSHTEWLLLRLGTHHGSGEDLEDLEPASPLRTWRLLQMVAGRPREEEEEEKIGRSSVRRTVTGQQTPIRGWSGGCGGAISRRAGELAGTVMSERWTGQGSAGR